MHEYDSGRNTKEGIGEAVSRDLTEGKVSLAVVATREEARDINEWAWLHAREKGLVAPEGIRRMTSHGEREFAEGDRILFTRNDRKLDVMNGDFGTVRETLNGSIRIELDRGGMKEIDPLSYPHLEYGYAATCHKLQGATVDRCHVYSPRMAWAGGNGLMWRPAESGKPFISPCGDNNLPGIGPPMGPVPGKGHDPRLRRRTNP